MKVLLCLLWLRATAVIESLLLGALHIAPAVALMEGRS